MASTAGAAAENRAKPSRGGEADPAPPPGRHRGPHPRPLEERLEELHPAGFAWSLACCSGDRGEAEDVLQSTYLKILDGRARFRGRSSFKTWLFAVIRRTAAEGRRRRSVRTHLLERWWRPARAEPADADDLLEASERALSLARVLRTLSRRQREVLELVFYHEQTLRQAAQVMGVTLGTASRHYARGKQELLRRLEGSPP